MANDTGTAVDVLVAKQAITEAIYTYCRALDRMDWDLAHTVWHPDGTADYGPNMFQGTGPGFIEWVWAQHAGMMGHSHQITNILIEVDGDRAASEAYVTAALRLPGRRGAGNRDRESRSLRRHVVAPRRALGDRPPTIRRGLHEYVPGHADGARRSRGSHRPSRPRRPVVRRARRLTRPAPRRIRPERLGGPLLR
jgi:hypothetical protein